MKKITRNNLIMALILSIIIVVLLFLIIISMQTKEGTGMFETNNAWNYERFYQLDLTDTHPFVIYVDKETKVQYIYTSSQAGLTVLVDQEGKPLLYEGDFND